MLDYLILSLVRVLIFPLQVLPESRATKLARIYLQCMILLIPRFRRVAKKNLQLAFPNKSVIEYDQIFKNSLQVLAESVVGFAKLPMLNEKSALRMADYSDVVKTMEQARASAPGKGVLIVCLHFGQAELLTQLHAILYKPAYILARGFGLKRLDAWMNSRRELFGHRVFPRKGGYSSMLKTLLSGKDVMILFDQNVKRNHAVFVDFFGIPAATTRAVATAALRSGSAIVLGTGIRGKDGRFTLSINQVPNPSDFAGSNDEKIFSCTRELNRLSEERIRQNPAGWLWFHRRWKTRPEGQAEDIYS